jgi:inosose dehydratase
MIATQAYGWSQLAARAGLSWPEATDWAMAQAVASGFQGWEPFVATPADLERITVLAAHHGLQVPSVFVTGPLHEPDLLAETEARIFDISRIAARMGSRFVMIYPEGGTKSDAQLTTQARALNRIGAALKPLGLTLCYHPEEPELLLAAHEFHHMLLATDPALVAVCLDPDTIWRGAGGSMIGLLDILTLYAPRIAALHLRQFQAGVWAETLGAGDIDYPRVVQALHDAKARPLLVVEHAYEAATPATLDPVTAHSRSCAYVRATFASLMVTGSRSTGSRS